MKLPKIYDHFRPGQIFTIDEAREKLQTTGNTLRKRLSELAARGYIVPIRQGLYRVGAPQDASCQGRSSPFAVAAKLTPFCYVAFKSALQLHAGETPQERDTVYVVSPTKFNAFQFEGRHYFWCQSPDSTGLEELALRDGRIEFTVRVTGFEKSLVDCLRRTAHAPALLDLITLCKKIGHQPDLDRILAHTHEHDVAAAFNRLGYFFECMQSFWCVPEEFFTAVEKSMSRKQTEWPISLRGEMHGMGASVHLGSDARLFLSQRNRWRISFTPESLASAPEFSNQIREVAEPAQTADAPL